MAIAYADRVKETTTTTGTGTITLAGAVTGFQAFGDELANAEETYYVIETTDLSAWEVGIGTYTTSGTTLSRDTIIASSNAGSAVNFGAGTKTVFATIVKQAFDGLTPTGGMIEFGGFTAPTGWLFCRGAAVSRTTYAALKTAITITQTGTLTSGSAVVTGLTDTADMRTGAKVEGTGVPAATTILTVDSGTQITLSANATATGSNALTFFPYGNGDGSTTFNVPNAADRFLQGASTTDRPGTTGGAATVTLTEAQLPAHSHALNASDATDDTTSLAGNFVSAFDASNATPLSNTTNGVVANSGSIGSTGSGQAHENRPPYLAVNFIIKT